jgi:hypothetical protein
MSSDEVTRRRLLVGGVVTAGAAVAAAGVFGDEDVSSQETVPLRDFAVTFSEWLDTVSAEGSSGLAQLIADLDTLNDQVLAATAPTTTTVPTTTTTAATTTTESATTTTAASTTTTVPPVVLWPGHQADATYVGMSYTGGFGFGPGGHAVARNFWPVWDNDSSEHGRINANHAADVLPWVSFKPPGGGASGWGPVAAGQYDASIRARARRYAAYTRPVLATFHHEPGEEGPTPKFSAAAAAQWQAAFLHILDVMENEVGSLGQVTFCPILHGWNLVDVGDRWLSDEIIARCPIIGVDCYESPGTIAATLDYLAARGVRQVGIGETGRGAAEGGRAYTIDEFQAKIDLFRERRGQLGVVCHWNSTTHDFAANPYPNGPQMRAIWDSYVAETCRLSDLS